MNAPMLRLLKLIAVLATLMAGAGRADDVPAGAPAEDAASKVTAVVGLLELVIDADEQTARQCLGVLTQSIQNRQLSPERLADIRAQLADRLNVILDDTANPLRQPVALLSASWGDAEGARIAREVFTSKSPPEEQRRAALEALIAGGNTTILPDVEKTLADAGSSSVTFRGDVLAALGRLDRPDVPKIVLAAYPQMESDLRPRAIEILTQRPEWTAALLRAIQAKQIDKDALNLNQLQRIALFKQPDVQELLAATYGAVRSDRGADRQQLVGRMRDFLNGTPGDPVRGEASFKKVCGQCHKLHGEGAEVGPDITLNGRNNWEQLLNNVFDPSAVIGPGYQARQMLTIDGRVLTGLPVEESDQRVVLKIQGGKLETIPRDQIELYQVSELSMMPEDLQKQLMPQEIADLFSFLALDKHPRDPEAKYLPGAPRR